MSDHYSGESFEQPSGRSGGNASNSNLPHSLKLSIDLLSVKNMQVAANIIMAYQLKLREVHTFQS